MPSADFAQKTMSSEYLLLLIAYLIGSVSAGIVVSRMLGIPDPRTFGSGNLGATNVLRTGRKGAALATLAGDVLKGFAPVMLARVLGFSDEWIAPIALAAFIGHLYPLWYGFKGGKGVATSLGVLLGLHWGAGVGALAVWLATAWAVRISSLSALVAALASPLLVWWTTQSFTLSATTLLMSALVWMRHRENLRKLMNGTEPRIGAGPGRSSN